MTSKREHLSKLIPTIHVESIFKQVQKEHNDILLKLVPALNIVDNFHVML